MKKDLIIQIANQLSKLGISADMGKGTDISISAEFLDASWSTGKKNINYEGAIYLDETSQTIYMWEKTSESKQGISFGGEASSSFQMGRTLFRKVKSIQYGPDGQAYEYTLDLGAIPKTVKEVAKENNWKFKTVLNREKAFYPKDINHGQNPPLKFETPPGQSQTVFDNQPQFSNREGTFYARGGKITTHRETSKGGPIVFWILEIVLSLLCIFMALANLSLGSLVGFGFIAILPIIMRKRFNGFFKSLLLWLITFTLFFIFLAVTGS